jgi:hypothetical protein
MENILKNTILRRNFWVTIGLFLALVCVLRLAVAYELPSSPVSQTVSSMLESLFATTIATAFIGAFLFYLTPATADPKQLEILPPREISAAFDEALATTNFWRFKGGFGRYLRTKTIPTLSEKARRRNRNVAIVAQIIDPRDQRLCSLHADLRNSTTTVDNRNDWTLNSVRSQLYATILTVLRYQKQVALLEIELYLANHFLPSRIDLSSDAVIVTREDRRAPAIRARRDSYFYDTMDHEISVTKQQSHRVLPMNVDDPGGDLTPGLARRFLEDIMLWDEEVVTPIMDDVCRLVNERDNPYA